MGRMWTLVLDTATPYLSLGLFRGRRGGPGQAGGKAARGSPLRPPGGGPEEVGAGREEIGALVLGEGPGSYTGLRIALAAGLGLAQALGARVFGASSSSPPAGPT